MERTATLVMMANESDVRVECAWCNRILQAGRGPVSHGLCEDCLPKVLAEVLQRADGPDDDQPRDERDQPRL